ncbi:hypothetical protein ALC53_06324 [Atta colombica]|uniref:Uncharacterized protein n=1 Tax=Atta colombica TaxID=520822 RepID=A0A195BFS4_9HYME|nr:hypothetical protein ALC53_06324 [Atta colombica]
MIYRILLLRVPIDNRSPHLHGNHPRTERSDHFWFATYVKLASIYTARRKSEPVERGRTVCSDARRYVLLHVSFTYKEERQADGKKEEDEDRVPERTRHEPRLLGFSDSPSFF